MSAPPRPPSVDALARAMAPAGLPHALCVELARAAVADGPEHWSKEAALARAEHHARTLLYWFITLFSAPACRSTLNTSPTLRAVGTDQADHADVADVADVADEDDTAHSVHSVLTVHTFHTLHGWSWVVMGGHGWS